MALVLEAGLRADRAAAERLLADVHLRRRSLAGWRQHVEALRMYGYPLAGVGVNPLQRQLRSVLIPRLEDVAMHACAPAAVLMYVDLWRFGFKYVNPGMDTASVLQ